MPDLWTTRLHNVGPRRTLGEWVVTLLSLLILLALLAAACGVELLGQEKKAKTKTEKVTSKKPAFSEDNVLEHDSDRVKTLWKAGYYQCVEIDGCQYIVRSTVTGDAITHKANCPNHTWDNKSKPGAPRYMGLPILPR